MRIASNARASPRRELANPGESRTTIGVLPSLATHPAARSMSSGAECSVRTISTSAERGTGLKKCIPQKRSGRDRDCARSVTDSEDVFVASHASAGMFRSASTSAVVLNAGTSGTASMTSWTDARRE
jgi:hypothetical protein